MKTAVHKELFLRLFRDIAWKCLSAIEGDHFNRRIRDIRAIQLGWNERLKTDFLSLWNFMLVRRS